MNNSYTIWIEAENWAKEKWDIKDSNTDVAVTFEDETRWIASFFTYTNIQTLSQKNQSTGECLNGTYFWGSDMILIDECSRYRIEEVIEHLIHTKEFELLFSKCEEVS